MACKACEERRKILMDLIASLKGADLKTTRAKLQEFRTSLSPVLTDEAVASEDT